MYCSGCGLRKLARAGDFMKVIIAVIGLSCFSTLACAEVSDDLKFCGSLKSAAERLACYDAAARIAVKSTPARPAARVVPLDSQAALPFKAAVLDPPPARNPFDGYYVGVGGGYAIATGRDGASLFGLFSQAFFASTSMHGANASVVAGRNIAVGWGIIGGEVSGRWSDEKFQDSQQARLDCCGLSFLGAPGLGTYSYRNDAGIHAAIRAGAVFDDLLVFGKVGVGATRVSEAFTLDERGIQRCIEFNFGGCVAYSAPGSLSRIQTASWLPSVLFGLGVEKNWGPFFGRLSADFEAFNHKSTSVSGAGISGSSGVDHMSWTTRGTALIGARF